MYVNIVGEAKFDRDHEHVLLQCKQTVTYWIHH